jgi:hypothetical protein
MRGVVMHGYNSNEAKFELAMFAKQTYGTAHDSNNFANPREIELPLIYRSEPRLPYRGEGHLSEVIAFGGGVVG